MGDREPGRIVRADANALSIADYHIAHRTDCEHSEAMFRIADGNQWTPIKLTRPSRNGICYIHNQSAAATTDFHDLLLVEITAQFTE